MESGDFWGNKGKINTFFNVFFPHYNIAIQKQTPPYGGEVLGTQRDSQDFMHPTVLLLPECRVDTVL